MIGKTISHYRILSKLGEGGMGVVYKAEDLTLGRTVALKFLPPDSVAREEDKARLVLEARAAAALLHPNICPIHEIAEAEGRMFISMAHIEGRSLKDRIADGPLPLDEALSNARQIGDALAAAHAKGIIHRDIKPANVMLTAAGRPMLMDFGLAKVAGTTKLTRTGTTMGTVAYMSPEQMQGRDADHRSDIWALGVMLYEMVSGRAPFGGDYEAAILYSILNEDPPPLAAAGSGIPAGLEGIVAKAMAKDPARRYQSAGELVADLDALARDSQALPAGKAVPAKGLKRIWRRWRTWQRAVAVTSIAALVILATLLVLRYRPLGGEAAAYSLAVMDFSDPTGVGDSTAAILLNELVNSGITERISADVQIVSPERLHDVRRRLFGISRGSIDDSQRLEVARELGATLYLVATIAGDDENRSVSWRLMETRNVRTLIGGREDGGSLLTQLADSIIVKALPHITRFCGMDPVQAVGSVASIMSDNPRALQHFGAGLLALEEGRRDDAITAFERAVALDSTFALAYVQLGDIGGYFSGKNRRYYEKAWTLKDRLGIKDRMRLEAGLAESPMAMIAKYREMRKRWPDDRMALIYLRDAVGGYFYVNEAQRITEEGLRFYPDDLEIGGAAYHYLLSSLGRGGEALRDARSRAGRQPDEPLVWENLGRMYLFSGLPDSAAIALGKSVELDPRLDPFDENAILVSYHRGDLAAATAASERAIAQKGITPQKRRALIVVSHQSPPCLAGLYIEAGRYRKAREVIREFWDPPAMEPFVLNQIHTRLLVGMSQWQEIVDLYALHERMTKADTTLGAPYTRDLGKAYAELGDARKAREVAAGLRGEESSGGGRVIHDANEIDARAALAARDPQAALGFLAEMRKNGFGWGGYIDIDYRTTLARAYRMAGDLEKAVDVHRRMLAVYGGHALSHYELGTLYEEMKRPADAKKEYAKFLEMWSEADADRPQLIDAKKRLAAL